MTTNYVVKVFCETCGEWKYMDQVDTVNPDEIPPGCDGHIFTEDSFCIDEKNSVG